MEQLPSIKFYPKTPRSLIGQLGDASLRVSFVMLAAAIAAGRL